MKQLRLTFLFLGVALVFFQNEKLIAASGTNQSELLGRYYFTGSAKLLANTNAARLKQIWNSPESAAFGEQVLQKFSRIAGQALASSKNLGTNQSARLIRPLLQDLAKSESMAEMWQQTNSNEFILAIKLSDERAGVWNTNLWKLLAESGAVSTGTKEKENWRLKKKESSTVFSFGREEQWVLFVWGGESSSLRGNFSQQIKKHGNSPAKTNWLEANIDWPRFQKWLPALPVKLARTEIALSGKADDLRTTVRAIYPEPVQWKSKKWLVPTNIVRDPLIGFTVARDLSFFIKPTKAFQQIGINPLTNEMYFWSQSGVPFQSFMALPVKDSAASLKMLSTNLPAIFNPRLKKQNSGLIALTTNRNEIIWEGLPIIVPYLKTNKESFSEFLVGGLFPSPPNKTPAPTELWTQINRPNLVYYDWELTESRLSYWQVLSQIIPILSNKKKMENKPEKVQTEQRRRELVAEKWTASIAPLLGNTITEATLNSPTELNILRKSPLGFTGLEIILFTKWINQPE